MKFISRSLSYGLIAAFCAACPPLVFSQDSGSAGEIGSLRHAKVAVPMPERKTEVTYFAGSMAEDDLAELRKTSPNLRIVTGLKQEEALARAEEAHGVESRYATPEFLAKAKNLAWVQAMSAGVEGLIGNEALVKNDGVILTNHRGVHGPAIADHTMAMLLFLTRDLRFHAANRPG